MLTRLVSLFQEKVENRYYGKYRAVVTNNEDPEMRGRLMVNVPSLLGETEIAKDFYHYSKNYKKHYT